MHLSKEFNQDTVGHERQLIATGISSLNVLIEF